MIKYYYVKSIIISEIKRRTFQFTAEFYLVDNMEKWAYILLELYLLIFIYTAIVSLKKNYRAGLSKLYRS